MQGTSSFSASGKIGRVIFRRKHRIHQLAQAMLRAAATDPSVVRSHLAGSGSPLTLATSVKSTDTLVKLVEPGLDAFPPDMNVGVGSVLMIDGERIQIQRVIDRCTLAVTRGVMG